MLVIQRKDIIIKVKNMEEMDWIMSAEVHLESYQDAIKYTKSRNGACFMFTITNEKGKLLFAFYAWNQRWAKL